MIAVRNITAGYARTAVLHDITAEVAAGEFVGFIGPNGSGKTTLLRVLSGVLPVWQGEARIEDVALYNIPRRELARTMACLSQDISMDLAFTVREVVLMGRSPHLSRFGNETRKDLEIVERAMALADVAHLADRLATAISGGERQRTFMAMCLAQEPRILLLDEPTSHLDIGHQLSLLDLIRQLNQDESMTVVAVFHDLNLAAEYCDKLVLLNHGRVGARGRPEDVLTAETIQAVYGARIVAQRNPVSQKPHIVMSAGMNVNRSQYGGRR